MISNLFKNYWLVLLVGAFFALTSIYNEFGVGRDVLWNVFAKLNREIFVSVLLFQYRNVLNNTISMLFCYGGISYIVALSIARLVCAVRSGGDYEVYYNFLKDGDLRLLFSIIIFVILLVIKYINKK